MALERIFSPVRSRVRETAKREIEKGLAFEIYDIVPDEVVQITGHFNRGLSQLGETHHIRSITGIVNTLDVGFPETTSLLVTVELKET